MEIMLYMKTFQISISKEDKHCRLKFKSELPIEAVLGAVKAVVKNTYNVSIKEIKYKVPEDRDIIWAINKAASVRFYHKVWKDTITEVPYVKPVCSIMMPKGTKIDYNISGNNTFFNVYTPYKFVTLDVSQLNKDTNLEIFTTNNGKHTFYLIGQYKIKCKEFSTFTSMTFYEIHTHKVINSEFITEEL